MAKIQEVEFPFQGTATDLNVYVQGFNTSANTCSISYNLTTPEGKAVYNDFYTLTEEEFQGWGQDNSYLDRIAAARIPVIIIEEIPVTE